MKCIKCNKDTVVMISDEKVFYYEVRIRCSSCGKDYSPNFLMNKVEKLEKEINSKTVFSQNSTLDAHEVAKLLKVNVRTICRYVVTGKLPAFRVGNKWRFIRKEIEAWIEKNKNYMRKE